MVKFTFKGLMAPTFTTFNADFSLNIDVIPKYAKFLAERGIKGILANGTTGEGPSLSVAERKIVTEAWLKAARDNNQHLMVQVGGAPLPDVLELAKHAEQIGVDSILTLPELYFKPKTIDELINYLSVVGKAAPKTPLLYYHIPVWSNVTIHMGEFLNAVVGKIPNFVGIKFTSINLDEGMTAVRAANGQFAVLLGADQLLAGAFALGFDSAIATSLNIYPELGVKILQNIQKSNVPEAQKVQNQLTDVCSVITKNGAWVPTMKVAMNIITPINVGIAREPLINLTKEQADEMQKDLLKSV